MYLDYILPETLPSTLIQDVLGSCAHLSIASPPLVSKQLQHQYIELVSNAGLEPSHSNSIE